MAEQVRGLSDYYDEMRNWHSTESRLQVTQEWLERFMGDLATAQVRNLQLETEVTMLRRVVTALTEGINGIQSSIDAAQSDVLNLLVDADVDASLITAKDLIQQ